MLSLEPMSPMPSKIYFILTMVVDPSQQCLPPPLVGDWDHVLPLNEEGGPHDATKRRERPQEHNGVHDTHVKLDLPHPHGDG